MKTLRSFCFTGLSLLAPASALSQEISTVQFTTQYFSVSETGRIAHVAVERSGKSTGAFTVDYSTSDAGAVAGEDYTAQNGTLRFADGETAQSITIAILNDALMEGFEQFVLRLDNATGGVFLGANSIALMTIEDNDFGVEFARPRIYVSEGEGVAEITVQRRGEPSGPFTLRYTINDDTAVADKDYEKPTGTLSFTDGETERTISIPILDDSLMEGEESVRLTLTDATDGVLLGSQREVVLTIVDNDGPPLDHWIPRDSGTAAWLYGVCHGDGRFVAVGTEGTILTSRDGRSWALRTNGNDTTLYGVGYGNGTFVAVGTRISNPCPGPIPGGIPGLTSEVRRVVWTSRDGAFWTESFVGDSGFLHGVAFGGGRFVAVGGGCFSCPDGGPSCFPGVVLTSPDGVSWEQRHQTVAPGFNAVAYGNGTFVAAGNDSGGALIASSTDSETWAEQTISTGGALFAAAHGDGMFVIAGGFTPGVILSSPDGLDWTERHTVDMHFAGLTFGNGTFVAVGYNRRIWSSPDGVAWIQRDGGPAVTALSDITFGQGTFLAVGADGTIIQSLAIPYPTPVVLSLTVTPEGAQLRFTGDAGRTYRLQRASNPAGPWTTFATLTAPPKGAVDHLDPAPLSSPTFYRVAAPWPPCSAGIEIGYCFHCFGGASGTY